MLNKHLLCLLLMTAGAISARAALPAEDDNGTAANKIDVPDPERGDGLQRPDQLKQRGPMDEILRFINGDELHGNLVRITPEKGLTWVRRDIEGELQVKLGRLCGIKLFQQPDAGTDGDRIVVTNGDNVYGKLTALTAESLHINTWFGGKLVIPRPMVARIVPAKASNERLLLAGFGKLSDWSDRKSTRLNSSHYS